MNVWLKLDSSFLIKEWILNYLHIQKTELTVEGFTLH